MWVVPFASDRRASSHHAFHRPLSCRRTHLHQLVVPGQSPPWYATLVGSRQARTRQDTRLLAGSPSWVCFSIVIRPWCKSDVSHGGLRPSPRSMNDEAVVLALRSSVRVRRGSEIARLVLHGHASPLKRQAHDSPASLSEHLCCCACSCRPIKAPTVSRNTTLPNRIGD